MQLANGRLVNLTKDLSRSTAIRGARQARITEVQTPGGGFVVSTLLITPYGATHQDQINVIDEKVMAGMMRELDQTQRDILQSLLDKRFLPQEFQIQPTEPYTRPCHLLDFTGIKDQFLRWQSERGVLPDTRKRFVDPTNVDPDDFMKLLGLLRIDVSSIDKILDSAKFEDINGHILIFNTGWAEISWEKYNLNHPVFQCWHPACLHPYLDVEAVDYLIDTLHIAGVGTDAISLEFPLAIIEEKYCMEYVSRAIAFVSVYGSISGGHRVHTFPYLHIRFLKSGCPIIEQLHIDRYDFAKKHWSASTQHDDDCDNSDLFDDNIPNVISGILHVHPLTFSRICYGIDSQLITAVLEVGQ